MSLRVIPRHEWGPRAPLGPPMTLPVGEANLHHSVTALTADPLADMRAIERIGIERFGIFSYSWAYHRPSRSLLTGAGDTIGAHTAGRNSRSLGLVLIGNYDVHPLDDIAVQDLGEALRWLVHTGRLTPDFVLRGHRDHKATACPGKHAYARLGDIRAAARQEADDMIPGWAAKAIEWAKSRGIITGDVRPNDPVTRAEAVTMLHRALTDEGGKVPGWAQQAYRDVGDAIQRPEPNAPITEARFVTILHRLRGR